MGVYLSHHLGVSINGCLEKQDLVNAIVESGRVDVIPAAIESSDFQLSRTSEASSSATAAERSILEPSTNTPALLAITDGEPIIQSFLGDRRSLVALSKRACSALSGTAGSEDVDQHNMPTTIIWCTCIINVGCWKSDQGLGLPSHCFVGVCTACFR